MAVSLKIFRGPSSETSSLRIGSRLDKYRLTKRLGEGGFATVYAATDLIEDRKVALKIPNKYLVANPHTLNDLHREVRIMAKLEHPAILPLKDARFIEGHFVIVFPLGDETLADRMTRRISRLTAIEYAVQMISAVAHAHEQSVLHRDIKPENFVLFPGKLIRLTDFGLARVEKGEHEVSGSGTLGYIAPEQAMGKPTYRSDVFSLGLVLYRLFSGEIPEYPFDKLPGFQKLRRGLSKEFVDLIKKAIDPAPNRRFRDGVAMHNAMARIRFPLCDRSVSIQSDGQRHTSVATLRAA